MAHLPKIIFSLCFLIFIVSSAFAQEQTEHLTTPKGSFSITPRVDLHQSATIYSKSRKSGSTESGFYNRLGFVDDADRGRLHFISDRGAEGWISPAEFNFLEDASAFIKLVEANEDVDADVKKILKILNQRFLDLEKREAKRNEAREMRSLARKNAEEAKASKSARERKRVIEEQRIQREEEAERIRIRQEASASRIDEFVSAGVQVLLNNFTFEVNSAGGLEPLVTIENISRKTIKYTTIESRVFNSVGDPVSDKVGDRSNRMRLKLVGPIESGGTVGYDFESDPPFYNSVASCVEVHKITVEFFDGSKYTMVNDLLTTRDLARYNVKNECAVSR
jgi:hypothetical protein